MRTKEFVGTCIGNPFGNIETLVAVIDKARTITKQTFLNHCFVPEELKREMREYTYDFEYYKNHNVYFYTHSAVEHFYL